MRERFKAPVDRRRDTQDRPLDYYLRLPYTVKVDFDGVADTVDYQLKELLSTDEGDARRYYRFQTVLDIGKDDMDDASATNIAALKVKAREIISKNDAALENLCAKLVA